MTQSDRGQRTAPERAGIIGDELCLDRRRPTPRLADASGDCAGALAAQATPAAEATLTGAQLGPRPRLSNFTQP